MFEKLFDKEVISLIVAQTNLYSSQKNDHSFFVSEYDIKIFVGILLLTGYHKLPRERLYWSVDKDLGVPFVYKAMSRNRFKYIKKSVHTNSRQVSYDEYNTHEFPFDTCRYLNPTLELPSSLFNPLPGKLNNSENSSMSEGVCQY